METDSHFLQGERTEFMGAKLETWRSGKGPKLVFLHPGTGTAHHSAYLNALAERFDVFAPSHPGFNNSDARDGCDCVDDLAYFYLDWLKANELADVTLVGSSFGGWIAAEMAIRCTSRLSNLVLLGPLGAKFTGPTERDILDLFSQTVFEQDRHLFATPVLRDRTYESDPEGDLVTMARNYDALGLYAWSPTLHHPKLAGRLRRIDVPTLVVWGEEDRVVGLDYGRQFAGRIPGAELQVVSGAGHYVHIDKPAEVVDAICRIAG